MRDRKTILNDFDKEYETLVDLGENLRLQCEAYATGSSDTRVSDLDDAYRKLKISMKKIRKLAIEVKK